PVADLVLADVPAEQHLVAAAERRKVDEATVEILYLDPELGDRLHAPRDLRHRLVDAILELLCVARRQPAAVACDDAPKLLELRPCFGELAASGDHPLGERPHVCERRLCFWNGEDPVRQARIITSPVSAPERVQERRSARRELRLEWARNPVPELFLWTRAAIWATALFAFAWFEPNHHPNVARWDDPSVTRDLGWVTDIWARWDSVFFLRIAEHGYDTASGAAAAFYPLYPALVGGLGRAFFGHYLLAGIVISLLTSLAAFFLLPPLPP